MWDRGPDQFRHGRERELFERCARRRIESIRQRDAAALDAQSPCCSRSEIARNDQRREPRRDRVTYKTKACKRVVGASPDSPATILFVHRRAMENLGEF